jgi:integrase
MSSRSRSDCRNLPKKRKADRVLSIDEVRAVWRAADSGFAFDDRARLMLLTGCRAGEWARARWPWVDLKQGLLSIPASEYKTNRPHVVPLVPEAVAILENSFRGGKGDYVLSTTGGEKPIRGLAKFYQVRLPSAILTKQGAALSAPFTSHDLRRSTVTHIVESLGRGGEPLIKRLLGHTDGSVTAIYNRYGYMKEMRAALEAWARELTR